VARRGKKHLVARRRRRLFLARGKEGRPDKWAGAGRRIYVEHENPATEKKLSLMQRRARGNRT